MKVVKQQRQEISVNKTMVDQQYVRTQPNISGRAIPKL